MSLNVHVFVRNQAGEIEWMEWQEYPRSPMFGSETARQKVWGSRIMDELGLEIIPSLSYMNVMVEREEVDQLEQEAVKLQGQADTISEKLGIQATDLRFYLENLIFAIAKAKTYAQNYPTAGVYIA